jgi:hypothetical protein
VSIKAARQGLGNEAGNSGFHRCTYVTLHTGSTRRYPA